MKKILLLVPYLIIIMGCSSQGDHNHDHEHDHSHASTTEHVHGADCNHEHDADQHDHAHDHELFGVIDIGYTSFGEVIRAGGEIISSRGDEQVMVANHDGLVFFSLQGIQEGISVGTSTKLITLTSGGLVHDNLEVGYLEAKAQYEKAKIDYERAQKLMSDTIIPEKDYLDSKLAFESSQLTYNSIKRNYESGGQLLFAPVNGYIKKIHVAEGEFVQTGQPLITITQNKRLVIKADVPQSAIPKIRSISSANFLTPYDGRVYSTNELNGRLVSFGKTTVENSFYIPIFFEVDNKGDLIPGTFIEVYLKTAAKAEAIAIPKSAVMEEFGSYYVFVDNHDDWEKRYIKIDGTDGRLVNVTDGLKVGEHIATQNVYRIKFSKMAGQLPEHAHVH